MLRITNATFITSAACADQFITSEKPIIAVCGKSNVGKSSFINMLANQKKLAKVSQAPGRTRLVNYFDFGEFILADLPGYGYAKVSKEEKAKWAKTLDAFFAQKNKITHVFSLCDIRHDPTADDRQMLEYLYYHIIPFTIVATKADKLSRSQQQKSLKNIAAIYKCGTENIIATSSQTRFGLDAVLQKIEAVISVSADEQEFDDEEDGEKNSNKNK
ncbi:MAG: YihA family ribosome biogenesis GTP-binding protein [Clostridiales bacterium]|nr:YihA family ribosome biogenesis GTP-binding protein [Clostridiales bacterium]